MPSLMKFTKQSAGKQLTDQFDVWKLQKDKDKDSEVRILSSNQAATWTGTPSLLFLQ